MNLKLTEKCKWIKMIFLMLLWKETICSTVNNNQTSTGFSNFNLLNRNSCNTTVLNALGLSGY